MLLSPPVDVGGGGPPLAGPTPPVGGDGTTVVLSWCYRDTIVLLACYRSGTGMTRQERSLIALSMPEAKHQRGHRLTVGSAAGNYGCWEVNFEGGTGAGQGVNQYDHFLATVRQALAVRDIDGDGEEDTLTPAGIVWMQGEGDARFTKDIANRYEGNLKRLMDQMRAIFGADDMTIVIGRISDSGEATDGKVWDHGEIVRDAQAAFVESDGHAALVTTTDNYKYSDRWHYDTSGYLDLGRRFVEALRNLHPR